MSCNQNRNIDGTSNTLRTVSSFQPQVLCSFYAHPTGLSDIEPQIGHRNAFKKISPSSSTRKTQHPQAARLYPITDDEAILEAIQHGIVASTLTHSQNVMYVNRLIQALHNVALCQALLDPCDFTASPFPPTSVFSLEHGASSLSASPPPYSTENSTESTTSNVSALKMGRDALSASDGLCSVKRSEVDFQSQDNGEMTFDNILAAAAASASPRKKKKLMKEGMPRRPLTAYNLFFREERAKILASIEAAAITNSDNLESSEKKTPSQLSTEEFLKQRVPGSKRKRQQPHGKIDFRVLATMIGRRWRELKKDNDERSARYHELAAKETERYLKEMKEYRNSQKED